MAAGVYPGDYTLESLARESFQFWPGTNLVQPLSKVYEDAAGGSAAARKAKKLLDQDRFRTKEEFYFVKASVYITRPTRQNEHSL